MSMIKISCAPAKHFKALKNGAIRRQKSPVSDPLWRLSVLIDDVMYGRLFNEKPTLAELWRCIDHVLNHSGVEAGGQVLMAMSLDKAIPGFSTLLQEWGLEIYVPRGSSGGLATVAKRWDKLLDTLDFCMSSLSESDLTVDESIALAGNDVGVIGPVAHEKDFEVAHALAKQACILRGRDPAEGARRWKSTGFETRPHTSASTSEEHDGLASLIREYSPSNVPSGYILTEDARRIYDIARSLQEVRRYPAESDGTGAARIELAKVLQKSLLIDFTSAPGEWGHSDYSRSMTPVSMVLSRWLGFDSPEIKLFDQGLLDACCFPFSADGTIYSFFRLPVQWRFDNGVEATRKVRYLPWREVVEHHLADAFPVGCRVILSDHFGGDQLRGDRIFPLCCSLLHAMRHGRRRGEEKGKRASAAVPKGNGQSHETTDVIGVIGCPGAELSMPDWKGSVSRELADAARIINANLGSSLPELEFSFGLPALLSDTTLLVD